MKSSTTEDVLSIWAALLVLLALPLAFFALFGLGEILSPNNLNHLVLELLLVIATFGGLLSPLALKIKHLAWRLRVVALITIVVAMAVAGLFSPLYRGFLH